jgi:plastocyanin
MSRALGYSGVICVCLFAIPGAPASVRADTITIHMKPPMAYDPPTQNVKAGDTVEWVDDGGRHSATPDSNQPDPFQASPVLSPGQTYSVTVSGAPRTIKYHCQIHGAAMAGTLVVVAP